MLDIQIQTSTIYYCEKYHHNQNEFIVKIVFDNIILNFFLPKYSHITATKVIGFKMIHLNYYNF